MVSKATPLYENFLRFFSLGWNRIQRSDCVIGGTDFIMVSRGLPCLLVKKSDGDLILLTVSGCHSTNFFKVG